MTQPWVVGQGLYGNLLTTVAFGRLGTQITLLSAKSRAILRSEPRGGLITGNSLGVTIVGKDEGLSSVGDIVIIPAFRSLDARGTLIWIWVHKGQYLPGGGALGAIGTTLQALGLRSRPRSFDYVDLHSSLGGQTLTVNLSGVPAGTAP